MIYKELNFNHPFTSLFFKAHTREVWLSVFSIWNDFTPFLGKLKRIIWGQKNGLHERERVLNRMSSWTSWIIHVDVKCEMRVNETLIFMGNGYMIAVVWNLHQNCMRTLIKSDYQSHSTMLCLVNELILSFNLIKFLYNRLCF
jgi:hypothetical protein